MHHESVKNPQQMEKQELNLRKKVANWLFL